MKKCYLCDHYGLLVNQGLWWCTLNNEMNAESCKDYTECKYGITISCSTEVLEDGLFN